jgi:hypothetical protein
MLEYLYCSQLNELWQQGCLTQHKIIDRLCYTILDGALTLKFWKTPFSASVKYCLPRGKMIGLASRKPDIGPIVILTSYMEQYEIRGFQPVNQCNDLLPLSDFMTS